MKKTRKNKEVLLYSDGGERLWANSKPHKSQMKKTRTKKVKTAEMYLQDNMLIRLNRLEELVDSLKYDVVDDFEEVGFTKEECRATIELIEYAVHNKFIGWSSPKLWNGIVVKLNKMLKESK